MHYLNEPAILHNLRERSSITNQRPYTFMSNVLIAVNPLKYLREPDKRMYIETPLDQCPPHPYYIAEVRRYIYIMNTKSMCPVM